MFRNLSFLLLLLFLQTAASSLIAQPVASKKTPRRTELNARDTLAKIDAYIAQARADWDVPGLAVAIVRGEEVLLNKGYGVLENGGTQPVNEHTLFAIASNSKAFTAAALAILVDEGKLRWDDPVSQYLPWLKLKDPWATADLRVRDLLCHRSGLGTFSGDLLWWGTSYSAREVLERAVHVEPAAPFRTRYQYSNLMFIAAGEVVAAVSGMSWEAFVQQRIFAPLGMNRTVLSVNDLRAKGNYATPHKTTLAGNQPIAWMNWDNMGAAGGIISSTHDMALWLQCQLREGAIKDKSVLFSRVQTREMWQAQTPIPVTEGSSRRFPSTHFRAYGLGWSLSDYQGHKVVGHGGGYDGMYSQVVMVPEKQLGIVVLTNSMTGISPAITYKIMDLYLGAPERDWSSENLAAFKRSQEAFEKRIRESITPAQTGTQPSRPLEAFTGLYRCPMYGDARIAAENGRLTMRLLPNAELVADLEHLHYDTFVARWRKEFAWFGAGAVHFVSNARGVFDRIELDIPNDDLWFYELKLQRVD